jgi:hypothetical protein
VVKRALGLIQELAPLKYIRTKTRMSMCVFIHEGATLYICINMHAVADIKSARKVIPPEGAANGAKGRLASAICVASGPLSQNLSGFPGRNLSRLFYKVDSYFRQRKEIGAKF